MGKVTKAKASFERCKVQIVELKRVVQTKAEWAWANHAETMDGLAQAEQKLNTLGKGIWQDWFRAIVAQPRLAQAGFQRAHTHALAIRLLHSCSNECKRTPTHVG
eukprot:15451036-Alexandrium_andersonii.AAC.1